MEEQNQPQGLMHTGAKSTNERINELLYLSQAEPEVPNYRNDLACEILTLLSKPNRKEDYKNFVEEFDKYKIEVRPSAQRYNAQLSQDNFTAIGKNAINIYINELTNINRRFDLVIRKVLRKYDIIMVDKKSTDKPIISEETEGDLK